MAIIIESHYYNSSDKGRLPQPIVYCRQDPKILDASIPLNVPLAQKLSLLKSSHRTVRLEKCFRQILVSLPEDPVIRDFDVLFNPDYKVDILQLMVSIGKDRPFRIVWPGKYEDGRLIYAEEGFLDYKYFELNKYNVTCIV